MAAIDDALNLSKLRVVIIDDNAFARQLLRVALSAIGVNQVHHAGNAADGLMLTRSVAPDLILLDWMMPSVDGISFLKQVRSDKHPTLRYTPVIMVTAYSEIWRVHEARDAGCNEFVVKPFSARTLFGKIRQLVETPRTYIEIPNGYFGPDRRRRANAVPQERRKAQPTPVER